MSAYKTYAAQLERLAGAVHTDSVAYAADYAAALDGGADSALRSLVPLPALRKSGAFFTGAALAKRAWQPLLPTLDSASLIADPSCGAGNLLLPILPHLARNARNLNDIPNQLIGVDIVEPFVKAARARLCIAAVIADSSKDVYRKATTLSPDDFRNIRVGDAIDEMEYIVKPSTHVIINPPYHSMHTTQTWSTGSTNSAAIFTFSCVRYMRSNAHLVAILPDVLRSGSRYARWRDEIESMAIIDQVSEWGQFDSLTQVHVFILQLRKTPVHSKGYSHSSLRISLLAPPTSDESGNITLTVGDYFKASVGAVVPHRHPESGPLTLFATVRSLPAWETVQRPTQRRRFSGTCAVPPFVAVRRTSKPGQSPRAIATIVTGTDRIAVDNHLIVLAPRDGTEARCEQLLAVLQRPITTRWLDEHFQCRHLTVSALERLPWCLEEDCQ